ncbi:MAG: PqqD family protein [Planctomycetota bacterium]
MTARLRLSDCARLAELHGEAVVLHLATGRYFAANATGAALLRALSAPEGATVEGLVDRLVAGHGADPARARRPTSRRGSRACARPACSRATRPRRGQA